ncbi:ABC-type glycerol-3-phosphate transport system substrate-binding protein [Paenibacillus cellulosilyticus]|uniref:ABC-type glycerol-3-phosphate transport system substrate-binding protein n=1 Tax=Paenibacillus cellulosilyticus TaxID=375489 RepID=A0A2V2YE80_9BACL|nr:extracellular solute-binding protein [Paenibacillus cellulosilyticus]PWV90597.1 ABC-type glycerol-3-phosphate transport system substrate-binding protein [Paenibacillus cellulosilyticus]QKS45238.1 extracellular solute-binding protein [Paenibacillus cellulosilyticus]
MELVVHLDEPWQKEAVEAIARRFEEMNPGVTVTVAIVPNAEIRANLYTGESSADLVQLFNRDIFDCMRDGRLLDLRPLIECNPQLISLFHPSIFRLIEHGEQIAVLPISAAMKGIFYNKSWFDKAGIPYPAEDWTWGDFEEIAIRLQESNVSEGENRYAARISFQREYMGLLLLTAGTDWLSPDGSRASGYTNSPQAVQAVQWAVDLVRKHQVARETQEYFANGDFLRNDVGIILDYYNMLHELQPHLQDDLGIAALPQFHKGQAVNEPWVCGFSITATTANAELAWSFLQELTCTSNELTRLVTEGSIAALRSVYSEVGHDRDPMRNAILSELSKAVQLPLAV